MDILLEMFQVGLYKRSQGRITRQVTCGVVWVIFALAAYALHNQLNVSWEDGRYIVPGILLAVGLWVGYRLVNAPRFADFLISVEAEMNKVSWPSRAELLRSSAVVIFVIFALAVVLFGFDLIWKLAFRWIGVSP